MELREVIRQARKRKGLTQKELGKLVGASAAAVTQWEADPEQNPKASSPGVRKLPLLAKVLELDPDQLFRLRAGAPQEKQIPALLPPPNSDEIPPLESEVDLKNLREYEDVPGTIEVFGAIEGGFDGAEINYEYPVERIPMPSILAGVYRACGCYVTNTSMEPRYYPGEIILIAPGKPVKSGDFVMVELLEHRGIVKRFVRQADGHVELEQLNPPQKVKIDRRKIVGIHLIVGSYSK